MKKVLFLIVMLTLAFGVLPAQTKKAAKPIEGKIVSLAEYVTGNFSTWTKESAISAAEKGAAFVLLSGTGKTAKVYFILTQDGAFASKAIAKFAIAKKVAVVGKVQIKGGMKFIVHEIIEPVE
jgi:hypothetical protein